MTAADFSALWHLFAVGFRAQWAGRAVLSGAIVVLGLLIGMWGFLWMRVDAGILARYGLDAPTMIWYLAMAETVIFAGGYFHRGIIAAVRDGRAAASLTRPAPWPMLELAEAAGGIALRFVIFWAAAALMAFVMTGGALPRIPAGVLLLMPLSMALACAIWMLAMMAIGLSTLWISASEPVFWLSQKLVFLFGGLVIPVSAMPEAFRIIGWLGPFAAILYAPASFVLNADPVHIAKMLAVQTLWLAATTAFLVHLWHAAVRRMMREG